VVDNTLLVVAINGKNNGQVKYYWVYDILTDVIEGYLPTEVVRHNDSKFTLKDKECIRGKVIVFNNKTYLTIWTSGYTGYPTSIIEKIVEKIYQKFNINYVVNESGQIIYE